MIADNIRVKIQHANDLGIQIKSQIQGGKLIINAYSLDDKIEYQGELQPNPYVDIQDIQELIDANKTIKIVTKTPTLLKIKVGAAPIQLVGKQKIDLQNLSETFEKVMKNQSLMQKQMKEQKEELNEHKDLIIGLKKQIEEMKLSQQEKDLKSLRFQQTFIEEKQKLQNGIQQSLNEIRKIREEIRSEIESIKLQPEPYKNLIDELKSEINQLKLECQKTSTTATEQGQRLKQHEIKIKTTLTTVTQQSDQLKQYQNQIKETVDQHSEQLKQHESKLKLLISCLQKKLNFQLQKLIRFQSSWQISRLNEPIRSCKWSEQLKSETITIKNNVVTKTSKEYYWQFCLSNASFSNTLRSKQSWAIQINKRKNWIGLGVCLGSKINYNFNDKNIKWDETGHGLYIIDSDGFCNSHSKKEFNQVNKSFKFGNGDVIYVEYDPIDKKLIFSKNKVDEQFELSIIGPPQNDAYHPCVILNGQNELILL